MEGFQGFGIEESGEDSDGMLQFSAALHRVCHSNVEPTPDGAIVLRERALPDYATQVQNVSRETTHLQQPAMSPREMEQGPSVSSSAETESNVQQAVGGSIAQATSTLTGLSHTGVEDRVTCYSCGEELSRWTPEDDPWAEHEKFQPRCEHVLQHRMGGMNLGSSDVDEVAQGHSVEASGDDSKSVSQHSENDPQKEEKNTSRQRAHETVEEELQRLHHQFACKTCFKEKACMVILPCCHLSACVICVEKLQDCNVCHQRIVATVKAYCA